MSETDAVTLVIDTNVVLDLFIYEDPATAALHTLLAKPGTRWLATDVMREELRRVLAYPHVVRQMTLRERCADVVLAAFDARAQIVDTAPKAPYTCKDGDDQKFIDLAAAHSAVLLSKDKAVLCMAKRLARLGVLVGRQWPPPATATSTTRSDNRPAPTTP